MRKILFRGKRTDNGEWVYGDFVNGDMICEALEDTENATGTYYGQTPYVGFIDVDPKTVGQYTGLKDKNGKKIFEGDVTKHEFILHEETYEIKFGFGSFCHRNIQEEENYGTSFDDGEFGMDPKLAGTIFAPFEPCILTDRLSIKVDGGDEDGYFNGVMPLEPWNLEDVFFAGDQAPASFEVYDGSNADYDDAGTFLVLEEVDVDKMIALLEWSKNGCDGRYGSFVYVDEKNKILNELKGE